MDMAHLFFGIIYKYSVVTLGLGINDNEICCQSCTEDPTDEGTLLVLSGLQLLPHLAFHILPLFCIKT